MMDSNNFVYNITLLAPPLFGEPSPYHYVSTDSYDIIRSDISETCKQLSLEKTPKAPHGFLCSSYQNQTLVEFYIEIYQKEDKTHVVQFRLRSGDRFAFAEILYDIQTRLRCTIPGARMFARFDDEPDTTNQEQMYEFMKELMFSEAPDLQKECLELLAGCSRQLRNHKEKERFVSETSKIVLHGLDLTIPHLHLTKVSSFADYFSINTTFDDDIIQKAKELIRSFQELSYHERRETIRLALALKPYLTVQQLDNLAERHELDAPANRLLEKLFF